MKNTSSGGKKIHRQKEKIYKIIENISVCKLLQKGYKLLDNSQNAPSQQFKHDLK